MPICALLRRGLLKLSQANGACKPRGQCLHALVADAVATESERE
jgi:hypothetical protein